jgi:two-component system OmpR family response regulator
VKILLVEDEPKMAELLKRGLDEEGHVVDICGSGKQALAQVENIAYEVIVLDWSLPDLDGLSVLRLLRERGNRTPVLMLTARGSLGERVLGLRSGADDYLVKPFDFDELLARVDALHRRAAGHEQASTIGSLSFDRARRTLRHGAIELALTAREFQFFDELVGHFGDTLSRSEILGRVWGSGLDVDPNIVDVYVGYLRSKLQKLNIEDLQITAVRGVGYRLEHKS